MPGVVDPHHHFWRMHKQAQSWRTAAHDAIAHDYAPADLLPELRRCGVDATVLIQSVDEPAENDRLAAYAVEAPFVAGVVAWLPLTDPPRARRELARLQENGHMAGRLRGVRCLIGRDPIDRLEEPDALALLAELAEAGLAWDVVPVTPEQTRTVVRIATAVPDLRIVVDHLARPPVGTAPWEPWAAQVTALAACPNIALKVSVGVDALTAWPAWDASEVTGAVAWAVRQLGPQRLMLASNWPVVLLRATYGQAWADLTEAVTRAGVAAPDLADVLGGTATRTYRLEDPRPA